MQPLLLAGAGALASLGSWVTYMAMVPSGRVPERPIGHVLVQVTAIGLGLAGLALGSRTGLALGPAVVALTMGPLFLFLLTQRKTPVGDLAVSVGDAMRPFTALDPDGRAFTADDLKGRRTLFKFFRGHW